MPELPETETLPYGKRRRTGASSANDRLKIASQPMVELYFLTIQLPVRVKSGPMM